MHRSSSKKGLRMGIELKREVQKSIIILEGIFQVKTRQKISRDIKVVSVIR